MIDEIVKAVDARGGLLDDDLLLGFDLRAATEGIIERAMAILSAALRKRLPGTADEMDEAFADRLRTLLAAITLPLPTF